MAVGPLYAHTPNEAGEWDLLAAHARRVAAAAEENAAVFSAGAMAAWLGIHHDSGKASESFQAYLNACATQPTKRHQTVDHKGAGALRAMSTFEPLALLVQGHHGGIPDSGVFKSTKRNDFRREPRASELAATLKRFDSLELTKELNLSPPGFSTTDAATFEFFMRMLFSALVDADHADTELHFKPDAAAERGSTIGLEELWRRFREDQAILQADSPVSEVNDVRRSVFESCLTSAELPPGFFRLTVPTGGGKTRSGLAFALKHAIKHRMRRVIVAVPYLTITDQTATVYRTALGSDHAVLEHHSNAGEFDDPGGSASPEEVWRRLACQDWDAPVVVTTTVQLFHSLFSNAPSRCRKLHRIAGSVIILDEAQTLPVHLRTPIFDVLRELVEHYNVSVVLCTATQPAFEGFDALAHGVREIVNNPIDMFRTLDRVTYEWPCRTEKWTWDQVAEEMRTSPQSLAIVNTVANAVDLYGALDDPDAFHLSTLLCAAHRREVLEEIRRRLKAGEPCRVVSTQVVEAGVDLDFPLVLRALGPLDRIVQAAGRCNREGSLVSGRVVVFDPEEGGLSPGAYKTASDEAGILINAGRLDLTDPTTFPDYFRRINSMLDGDRAKIQRLRASLSFEQVAQKFQMIPDDTASVLVRYGGMSAEKIMSPSTHKMNIDRILADLRRASFAGSETTPRALLRAAQPYLVSVRKSQMTQHITCGFAIELLDGFYEWRGGYDARLGLNDKRIDPTIMYLSEPEQ